MRIFDCFTYCGEDTLLDIRLKTLDKYVDYFVIVEGTKFHSGKKKEKKFKIKKFLSYKNKIRYFLVENFPKHNGNNWIYEKYQRNCIKRGLYDASPEDVILVSDLDEIPNLNSKDYKLYDSCIFLQNFYYYKFNLLCYEGLKWKSKWPGTKSIKYKFFKSPQLTRELRVKNIPNWRIDQKVKRKIILDGGWHFSYLMTPQEIVSKIKNFAHKEFLKYGRLNIIKDMISKKKDLFERKNLKFKIVKIDKSYPAEIYINQKKYKKWIELNKQ